MLCLVVAGGSLWSANQRMFSTEGRAAAPHSPPVPDFSAALAVLFGNFNVFNIEYQAEALEFAQRRYRLRAEFRSNLQRISSLLLFQMDRRTEGETLACVLASVQGSMGSFCAPTVKCRDYHSVSSSPIRIIGFHVHNLETK